MIHARTRRGFSLLEIILALSIFTGAIVMLGELMRLSLHNAATARDVTHAQLLCESKLAEITSGAVPAVAVSDASCGTEVDWRYAIELLPTDALNLVAVRVRVYRADPAAASSQFELVRWIEDPGVQLSDEGASNAGSTGSAAASSSGGGR